MKLSTQTLSLLAVASITLSVLALLIAGLGSVRRRVREPEGPIQLDDALRGILEGHARSIKRLEQAVKTLNVTDKRQESLIEGAVRHVGLVRYDAFEDVGGRLSFSCAMLDDHGSGVVVTSINGRQDTRVYAKPVADGKSPYHLSFEEEEAVRRALAQPLQAVRAT